METFKVAIAKTRVLQLDLSSNPIGNTGSDCMA